MKSTLTIKQVLKQFSSVEIDLLLCHILGKPREFLYMNPKAILSSYHANILSKLIKRRQKGEPLAYILGYKDFYGLRFKVNKNVLIPRPETEWLVHKVLSRQWSVDSKKKLKLLDMGTGSGCIIISLAKALRRAKGLSFFASDVSPAALSIAKQNAKIQKTKIKFIKSNLFQNINGKYNVIIANLPYVPSKIYELRIKNLEWEPKVALTDGTNKFVIYEKFFQQVSKILNPKSLIYLEIDPKAKPFVISWAKKYLPKAEIKFYRDLNNLWRYAEISL